MTGRTRIGRLTDDYSRTPVLAEDSVTGFRVAMVIIGFAITLPLMVTGSRVGLSLGLRDALVAFVGGGLVLTGIGSATAVVAAQTRLSTYKILELSFGRIGAKIVSAVLACTLFGWYGVTAALFGQALSGAAVDLWDYELSIVLGTILGSVLMVAITVFGFKALDRLSLVAVPLLAVFLIVVVVQSLSDATPGFDRVEQPGSLGIAVSIVVGTYIVGAVLVPDLCRYVKSVGHGVFAIVLALGFGLPLILAAAAVPSLATRDPDLVDIMMKLGLGLPALLVIVFATWTSNANNLYSTSLGLAAIVDGISKWKITIGAGVAGTLVAVAGIADYFIPFLLALGIGIPPIAGIYLADYFILRRRTAVKTRKTDSIRLLAFAVWAVATGIGTVTAEGWLRLTGIPACDSFLAAALLYGAVQGLVTNGQAQSR